MSLETASQLKKDWTDRYVVVVEDRPELLRFVGKTGQVKTVNMNGRCLVEFDGDNNIGWYDIDPSCLTQVEKPDPNAVKEKKAAPKPAAQAEAPAAKAAPAKPAAAAKGGRPSISDILAAARANAPSSGGAATATPAAEKPAPKAAAPKAAPAAKAAAPAKGGAAPTDTAGKIAWCREHDARG